MKKYLKIFKCLIIIMIVNVFIFNTSSQLLYAQTGDVEDEDRAASVIVDGKKLSSMEANIAVESAGLIGKTIIKTIVKLATWLITIFVKVIGLLCMKIGISTVPSQIYFPMPDHIVYNLIPFFDPNFINPTEKAPNGSVSYIQLMSDVIAPIYYSAVSFVGSMFVIIALLIGIKLAISLSPEEKSQYKTAIGTWLLGIGLLFAGHFIMAVVFFVNEKIVASLYSSIAKSDISYRIFLYYKDDPWLDGSAKGWRMGFTTR